MKGRTLRRVFVWELPVRIFHWLNAAAIMVLCATGYLIGNPPAMMSSAEASYRFLFGTIRFLHFAAAYIFVFNFLFRIYWGFVGNKYAQWRNFIPTSRRYFDEIRKVIQIDIFLKRRTEHLSVGHNALAGFMYFIVFIVSGIMAVTGFGLLSDMSSWWFPKLFAWVPAFMGGDFAVRDWHHALMWFFVLFTIVHVYLVFYHDYVEGRGEISSMGGGWKFIEEEVFKADSEEEQKEKRA
jgi:Ni/Fe-hydrogenase 1 B-type cytochrome subunit